MKRTIALLLLGLAGPLFGQTPQYVRTTSVPINAARAVFGVGRPIASLTTSGSCTSNPTVTISAPQSSADGSQATANGYCVNGAIQTWVSFPGGGYTSATCTITGGGTSSPACTVNLLGSAQALDPSNANDSSAALQNAVDYAFAHAVNSNTTASVHIPQGEYNLAHRILVPCDETVFGDGPDATVLNLTDTSEDGLIILSDQDHPDNWDCRGELSNLEVYASQGHLYTASEIANISGTGWSMRHVTISGGGGRGFNSPSNAERQFLQNIEIDTVRWPMVLNGNENHVIKLNIASPGKSADIVPRPNGSGGHYCWSVNCSNGASASPWGGGTLEYASANGSTATFYVHPNSPGTYPLSPIVAGLHFDVTGTTGTALNGFYTATSVTNNLTSDPSGQCSASNVCFEVQAASSANGVATLTAPTTTATFSSGSYEVTVASTTNFTPEEFVSGTGIAANSRIQSVDTANKVLVLNNPTTAAESSITLTGAVAWTPAILPPRNSAVSFGGANVDITDGSIKDLHDANCFLDTGTFGSSLSNFYCEGYPVNGMPNIASTFQYGGDSAYTTLTSSLAGSAGAQSEVSVASTLWFGAYVNDRNYLYTQGGQAGQKVLIEPEDFSYGSTTPSAYVSGVEQGQYEVAYAYATGSNKFVIMDRNASGSTTPSGTTWPAGSIIAGDANSIDGYGTLTISHMHPNSMDASSNPYWSSECNDQSENVCAEWLIGSVVNEKGAFTTGQAYGSAGATGVDVLLVDNENWNAGFNEGAEAFGEGFIKTVGQGGGVGVISGEGSLSTVKSTSYSTGSASMNGKLYQEGYVNVPSFDGSYPYGGFHDLSNGVFYSQGLATGGYNGGSLAHIRGVSGQDNLVGSPSGANVGIQFNNSYCFWDTSSQPNGHAQTRWCMVGGPTNSTPDFQMDTWNGSAWVNSFTLTNLNNIAYTNAANTFSQTQTFGTSSKLEIDNSGEMSFYNSSGTLLWFLRSDGNFYTGFLGTQAIHLQNSVNGTDEATITALNGTARIDMNDPSGYGDDGADVYGKTFHASSTVTAGGGTKTVYECATAGTTLPAGSLTTVAADCGSTTDTGLRVQ